MFLFSASLRLFRKLFCGRRRRRPLDDFGIKFEHLAASPFGTLSPTSIAHYSCQIRSLESKNPTNEADLQRRPLDIRAQFDERVPGGKNTVVSHQSRPFR